jgi:hypothetical protein
VSDDASAEEIRALLKLEPNQTCGFVRVTYVSEQKIEAERPVGTARVIGQRRWFLGSSTDWPGVIPADVELGDAEVLAKKYPAAAAEIRSFPQPAT